MNRILFLTCFLCAVCFSLVAQQRVDPKSMHYLISTRPNNIIYNDTIYQGSVQFRQLFYRTHNPELINFYQKHQSNKIAGQLIGVAGTLASIFGGARVSSSNSDKATGWILLGGGLAATLTGGYLSFMGQRNLQMAVDLFNQQHNKTAMGIAFSGSQAGLVFTF